MAMLTYATRVQVGHHSVLRQVLSNICCIQRLVVKHVMGIFLHIIVNCWIPWKGGCISIFWSSNFFKFFSLLMLQHICYSTIRKSYDFHMSCEHGIVGGSY